MSKLILLRSFLNPNDAHFAKSILEDANIPCFIHDENTSIMAYGYSNALGGVKLMIPEEFAVESVQLLDSEFELLKEGEANLLNDEPENLTCPACGSERVYSSKSISLLQILLAFFVAIQLLHPIKPQNHTCRVCRKKWRTRE